MTIAEIHIANIAEGLRRNYPKLPELIIQMRATKIHENQINGIKTKISLLLPIKKNIVKSYIY